MAETLIVYVDKDTIDVREVYRLAGFADLPPTPTLCGWQLRGQAQQGRRIWTDVTNGYMPRELFDNQSVPVKDGDRFYSVPVGCY